MSQNLRIRPKLVVEGANEALDFYGAVFGAEVKWRYMMADKVVAALFVLPGGDEIEIKDADQYDHASTRVIIDVVCEDPDTLVHRAVIEQGAEVVFDVADQPYGSRQGRIRDPWGVQWIVGTDIALSPDEVQAALDQWADEAGP